MEALNTLTAETIISDEVLTEVFDEEDEIQKARLLLSLQDRADELGVKTKFTKLVAAYNKVNKQIKKCKSNQQSGFDNYTQFDYFEDGHELYCGNWMASEDGISIGNMFGESLACYHPILPVQRLINAETGKEKIKIAFKKGLKWKEIVVDKGTIASANKIVSLADYGVSVTSETSRALVKFLSDLENFNISLIDTRVSTSKFGWINGEFMPYGADIEFDSESRFKDIFESVQEHGDRQKWFDLISSIRSSDRFETKVYMAGSFASVLLKPLSVLPFIVNLWGETGKGKTVALMVATSIWANPGESKYMTDPVSTLVSLEVRADILNNLPMVIDDLSKTRDKYGDSFTDFIYMLCGGKGKDRSNVNLGINQAHTWQNVTLTNIERPLCTDTMRGGAINRILDFEMAEGSIFKNGNAVVELINKNYGFAGKMFIDAINDIGFDAIREMQEDFLEKINERAREIEIEKEEKQTIPLSVMLTADKIATDYIFQDDIYLDLNQCVDFLKNKGEVSENDRAYDFIMSEVSVNINKFKPDERGEYKGEVWGVIEKGYVIILSNAFNRIAEKGNFSGKGFLNWAEKRELLRTSGGRNTKTKRIGDSSPRCVWLKMQCDIEEFEEIDGQTVIPFS
ncbi:MAG: DUF927 domain-containing protein [Lachnotalea sp.]